MRRNKLFEITTAVLMLVISACGSKDLEVDTNKEELAKKINVGEAITSNATNEQELELEKGNDESEKIETNEKNAETEESLCTKTESEKEEAMAEDKYLDWKQVEYSCNLGSIRIKLPDDWEYSIQEVNAKEEEKFSVCIYPKGMKDKEITICYWENFGVCGTGLETEDMKLNEMSAYKGIYDGKAGWDFIRFTDEYENYVVLAGNGEKWWVEYEEQLMEILGTLMFDN